MQTGVDYTALHQSHEVILRVELLEERLSLLSPNRDASILEIGLGSGDTTKMLVERYADVTCVDLEQARIEEVRRFCHPKSVNFICANGEYVRLLRRYDHIFLIGLLEHCPDGEAVLINARKHLAPDGRVHVLVNNANSIHRYLGVGIGDIKSVHDLSPADIRFGHHRIYTPNSLYAEISRAGLMVDYVDEHYMKPLPSRLMDTLTLEHSRAFLELGRRFPQFAAYTYVEAVAR